VGKTVVTSSMLDRVSAARNRPLLEVPVGFKWFVPGLRDGSCGLGCEESAGASFLRRNGEVWSTDKDGILLCLLAAEITAKTGKNPAVLYAGLGERFGSPLYERMDSPLPPDARAVLLGLTPDRVRLKELAGSPVSAVLTRAPGNNEAIGGIKVVSADGWFAVRPSGTEAISKVYVEGFRGEDHFRTLKQEALAFLADALAWDGA
jgi:phosphoglucomutase